MTSWQPSPVLMGVTTYLLSQTARMVNRDLDQQLALRGVRLQHMAVLPDLAYTPAPAVNPTAKGVPVMAGPSQLEVGRRLSIGPSDMTAVVDKLESLGHVARTVDPANRRRRYLQVSAPGSRFLGELTDIAKTVEGELLRRCRSADAPPSKPTFKC